MRRFLANPTVRGLAIVAAIALAIVVLNLYVALATVSALLRIAFFLAIAFFVFLVWRERRSEIDTWSRRAKWVFYGGAVLLILDFAFYFAVGLDGYDQIGFLVVLLLAGFSMFRVWRDEHTFG